MSLITGDFDSAIITYVVKKYSETSKVSLGRTILQKLCYFVKSNKVPLKYEFEIYHYGPYSQNLYFDVELLKADDLIIDMSEESGKSIYKPGENAEVIIKKYKKEFKKYQNLVDEIIFLFKNVSPKDFELYATVHYLCESFSKYYNKKLSFSKLSEKVFEIKGNKFGPEEIKVAYKELNRARLTH